MGNSQLYSSKDHANADFLGKNKYIQESWSVISPDDSLALVSLRVLSVVRDHSRVLYSYCLVDLRSARARWLGSSHQREFFFFSKTRSDRIFRCSHKHKALEVEALAIGPDLGLETVHQLTISLARPSSLRLFSAEPGASVLIMDYFGRTCAQNSSSYEAFAICEKGVMLCFRRKEWVMRQFASYNNLIHRESVLYFSFRNDRELLYLGKQSMFKSKWAVILRSPRWNRRLLSNGHWVLLLEGDSSLWIINSRSHKLASRQNFCTFESFYIEIKEECNEIFLFRNRLFAVKPDQVETFDVASGHLRPASTLRADTLCSLFSTRLVDVATSQLYLKVRNHFMLEREFVQNFDFLSKDRAIESPATCRSSSLRMMRTAKEYLSSLNTTTLPRTRYSWWLALCTPLRGLILGL